MNDTQKRRFERLARVRDFVRERAADFPAESKGGQAFARLNAVIQEAEALDTERATKARIAQQATSGRQDERGSLRAQLAAISDTAETIGLDHAEARGIFQRLRTNVNDQTLLSTARSFAAAALPLKARFIEYDMPADFLDRLNASIGRFEQTMSQQNVTTSARSTASAALEDALGRGEQELERIDTSVRNKFRDESVLLSAWERARRLERPSRTHKDDSPPPVGASAPPDADATPPTPPVSPA